MAATAAFAAGFASEPAIEATPLAMPPAACIRAVMVGRNVPANLIQIAQFVNRELPVLDRRIDEVSAEFAGLFSSLEYLDDAGCAFSSAGEIADERLVEPTVSASCFVPEESSYEIDCPLRLLTLTAGFPPCFGSATVGFSGIDVAAPDGDVGGQIFRQLRVYTKEVRSGFFVFSDVFELRATLFGTRRCIAQVLCVNGSKSISGKIDCSLQCIFP